jgi:hypothetical protein
MPGQPPQYGKTPSPYVQPTSNPPYQQYQGSGPPPQPYPPHIHAPYPPTPQNQQYSPSGSGHGYNQPAQQPYSAPISNPQYYDPAYQAPPYNQNPPPYGGPGYQNPPSQLSPSPAAPPYQQPVKPYPLQNGGYGGAQWNNTPPSFPPNASSQYPQPNKPLYTPNYAKRYSGTPQQQPQSHQTTPQTPASSIRATQQTPTTAPAALSASASALNTPRNQQTGPSTTKPTSNTSTPFSQRGSSLDNNQVGKTEGSVSFNTTAPKASTAPQAKESEQKEEGELSEEDLQEQDFNWELNAIFHEDPPKEIVALAQPLATSFGVTPVPLLHSNPTDSVSRYVKRNSMKDFIRPVRTLGSWDYLKEDPGYCANLVEGDLIPLEHVPAWMAARHGTVVPSTLSKKRERSHDDEVDEQQNVDNQIQLEISSEEPNEGKPKKRQRVEEGDIDMADTIIVQAPGTPNGGPGTPTLRRVGTPSLDTEDDVWAPQPGEGALSVVKADPTEALLASLGVSGSPKPVRKQVTPPVSTTEDDLSDPPYCNVPKSSSPQENPDYNMRLSNGLAPQPQQNYGNDLSHNRSAHNGPPQGNPSYNAQAQNGPPQGNSAYNGQAQNNPQYDNHQFGLPRQNSYGNDLPPQAVPPVNNAWAPWPQPLVPNERPHVSNSYLPPHQGGYPSNPPYNMPPQGYGPPHGYTPSGPPQQLYGPYGNLPYGMAPPGNPAYNSPQQGPYGTGQATQGGPSYGAQVNQSYGSNPYGTSQVNAQYPLFNPPQGTQPPFNPDQGNQPPFNSAHGNPQPARHDSGYESARGSYSNGSGMNKAQSFQQQPPSRLDGSADTPSPPEKTPVLSERRNSKSDDTAEPGNETPSTPLTPTSAEILGKLNSVKPGSAKKADDSASKKLRRPQPVVAEAYR